MTDEFRSVSRRQVLLTGVTAGLSMAAPRLAGAAAVSACCGDMLCRKIPSTGETLPAIGVGTNRFGRAGVATVKDILAKMYQMGGRVIDTAALYGDSEAVIGQALGELDLRDEFFIATKFNAPGAAFSGPRQPARSDEISARDSFDRSLDRLEMERVDLLFAHFVSSVEPLMPLMTELKEKGLTRYIGITSVQRAQHPRVMDYLREYPIDFLQIDYSLENRDTASDVLPLAVERNIAIMVAVPFGGRRSSLFAKVAGRPVPEWAAEFGATSWAQFFLKYVVAHPAVTCVIPGTTDVEHMADNQAAGRGDLPDDATRRRMEQFWDSLI